MPVKAAVISLLKLADIEVGGSRPWDIQVHDERFYHRVLRHQELGFGEAYMDGWWSSKSLDETVAHILLANLKRQLKANPAVLRSVIVASVFNRQTIAKAQRNTQSHYDIGNDLYELMLDEQMVYTCAYWKNAKNLDEAQTAKLDLVCRKLQLKKGMKVLEIGCGWGAFAVYAAKHYGVQVTAMTPAVEQVKVARQRAQGLPVEILSIGVCGLL